MLNMHIFNIDLTNKKSLIIIKTKSFYVLKEPFKCNPRKNVICGTCKV